MKSADQKRPLKVFLCHAHADRDPVRALYTRLTNDGVDAWLDKEKLLPGQDWELEIKKAVREADVVVVCLSNQFNQRGFRQKEVRLALDTAMEMPEGEIFIIPARLEECENLESLRKWHWVNLFENDGYEKLIKALANQVVKERFAPLKIQSGFKKVSPSINPKKLMLWGVGGLFLLFFAVIGLFDLFNFDAKNSVGLMNLPFFNRIVDEVTSSATSEKDLSAPAPSPISATKLANTATVINTEAVEEWTGIISARMPTLNEIRGNMLSIWDANTLTLTDLTSPGTRSYSGTATPNKEYLWPIYWCAVDNLTLEENVANMNTIFTVNGESVPEKDIFEYYYDTNNGWSCYYLASVIGEFRANTTINLEIIRSIENQISDGVINYPIGNYVYQLTITTK